VPKEHEFKLRRTWPQRILIIFGFVFVGGLVLATNKLDEFEEAVGSIVRIDVPSGVLAELPSELTQDIELEEVELAEFDPLFSRNFLLIGTDSAIGLDPSDPAADRDHPAGYALADVIMLIRVDPTQSLIHMMSLPRDLYLPIFSDGMAIREEKLASAMLVGGLEKGAPTLVETVSANFEVPIHNFVILDFFGFEQLVDLIGGVNMWFEYPIRDLASQLFINNSGCNNLDGKASLAYVRSRKLEALVDGWWRRVGVSNDMERNERQQDFMIRILQELVDRGIPSLLTDTGLLQAATEMVVFDERLTLKDLFDLGNAFANIEPDRVIKNALPVMDAQVGDLSVLIPREGWSQTLEVFRGSYMQTADVPILLVDSREDDIASAVELYLVDGGFPVQRIESVVQSETVIRASPEQLDQAVFVGRVISPIPRFEFVEGFDGPIELVLGLDFQDLNWPPASTEEVERIAQSYLDSDVTESSMAFLGNGYVDSFPMFIQRWQQPKLVDGVDGIPPEGITCG